MRGSTANTPLDLYLPHLQALPFIRDVRLAGSLGAPVLQITTASVKIELPIEVRHSKLSRMMVDAITARSHRDPYSWILLAHHVGRRLGRELVESGINFVDLSGNCHLRVGDEYVALTEGRPPRKAPPEGRGMGVSGHKVLFAILAAPELLDAPVRTLAQQAGAGKSVAAAAVSTFQRDGLIGKGTRHARLLEPQVLLERWLAAYAATVRPKLLTGVFRTHDRSPQDLEARVEKALSSEVELAWAWSGGAAAMRLTGHYRGERSVLCTGETPDLARRLRVLSDDDGPFVILRAPGPIAFEGAEPRTAHPLLVYSELLVGGDPRAKEAASEIRERYLGQLK